MIKIIFHSLENLWRTLLQDNQEKYFEKAQNFSLKNIKKLEYHSQKYRKIPHKLIRK